MRKNRLIVFAFLIVCLVIALTACGKEMQFRLNFIVDGAVYATIDTSGNEVIRIPDNPTKEGTEFDGWYWDNGVWQKPFTANSLLDAPLSSDMNVYAKWKADVAGGNAPGFAVDGNALSISVSNDTTIFSFNDQISVGEGSTWQISTDVSGTHTIPSKTVSLQEGDNAYYLIITTGNHVELYQITVHRRSICTVTFSPYNPMSFLFPPSETVFVEEGGLVVPPDPVPQRNGFSFLRWDFDFSTPIIENTTIFAIWEPISYSITYNLSGGMLAQNPNPTTYTAESGEIIFSGTPSKENYIFTGWDPSSISRGSYGNLTVQAKWTPTPYTITYDLNGGTNSTSNPKTYTVESNTVTFANPTRNGYDFAGWSVPSITHGSHGNKTTTASWSEPIIYSITYDYAGGILENNPNPTEYTIESDNITISGTPTKKNYLFAGWSVPSIPTGSFGNIIIKANWDAVFEVNASDHSISGLTTAGKTLAEIELPVEINGIEITSIGPSAFRNCTNLTSVTIPEGITNIGVNSFEGCANLTSITIPNSVTSIGAGAFQGCSELTDITIPAGVSSIGNYAFAGCSKLTSIVIPDGVESIGGYAFSGCSALTSMTIPECVEYIGESPLANCSSLETVSVPFIGTSYSGSSYFGYLFSPTDSPVTKPNWTIPSSLQKIVITGGESVPARAFASSYYITEVYLPESVTSIGYNAFYDCRSLSDIFYSGTTEQWNVITKGSGWISGTESYIVHCLDGELFS